MEVIDKPIPFKRAAVELAIIPFPTPEITPPVTIIYFIGDLLELLIIILVDRVVKLI